MELAETSSGDLVPEEHESRRRRGRPPSQIPAPIASIEFLASFDSTSSSYITIAKDGSIKLRFECDGTQLANVLPLLQFEDQVFKVYVNKLE